MTERKYTEQGWRNIADPSQHHRENLWDYKGRAIYHVTLCVAERLPIFGEIKGDSAQEAHVALNEIGRYVDSTFRQLPEYYRPKGISLRILAVQVMPDHMHGVIQVLEPMPKSIGEVVRSFKSACTSWYKSALKNEREMHDGEKIVHFSRIFATATSIWEKTPAGYHERILHAEGQLKRMIQYDKENPRRAWLKRANPELFRIRRDMSVTRSGVDIAFSALGNIFLLDWPKKQVVECSRSATPEQIEERKRQCLRDAQEGVVNVTAAISQGEKEIARALRGAGYPMIILLKDGFPATGSEQERYYKPQGVYFEACAAGRLLLIEPKQATYTEPTILRLTQEELRRKAEARRQSNYPVPTDSTRYRFVALNEIGRLLSEEELPYNEGLMKIKEI